MVTLDIVPGDTHNKVTVMATVIENGRPGKKVGVKFYVDDRLKRVVTTDASSGTAELELTLKVGDHVIAAVVAHTGETEEVAVEIKSPAERSLDGWDWVRMLIFWVAVLAVGPGKWTLTFTYLALAIILVGNIAKMRGKKFWEGVVCENNWVFFSVVGMAILSGVLGHFNPLLPRGPGGWLKDLLFSTPHEFGRHSLWRFINKLYFGKALTRGWSQAAVGYALWAIPAGIVSFWDNVREGVREWRKKKAGGGVIELVTHAKYEIIFEVIGSVLKGIFRGAAGK